MRLLILSQYKLGENSVKKEMLPYKASKDRPGKTEVKFSFVRT